MRARGRSRARALAAALTLAALAAATAASAHHGEPAVGGTEPGTLGADNTGGTLSTVSTDTELTPVAKPGAQAGWQQLGGSLWRSDGTITDMATPSPGQPSPTPYDLDFFGLDFLDKTDGFAVGAQCRRDPADPSQPVPPDEVSGCERIPVIYRYREDRDRGLVWEESYRGSDADDRGGFVAAVAWLGPNRALAVGGAGTYPRREQEREPGIDDSADGDTAYARRDACQDQELQPGEQCQGAGMARAWIFHRDPESEDPKLRLGFWRELQNLPDGAEGDEIPDQMRALNAIDASPRPADCLTTLSGAVPDTECAIAGGMRQLWHFADGHFTKGYGPELNGGAGMTCTAPTGTTCTVASNFRFRIRDIRFYPNWSQKFVDSVPEPVPGNDPPSTYAVAVTSGCCAADRSGDRPAMLSFSSSGWKAQLGSGTTGVTTAGVDQAVGRRGFFNPDSYYALTLLRTSQSVFRFALRTPGGPSERYVPHEPPSRFISSYVAAGSQFLGRDCDSERCAIEHTASPTATAGLPAQGTTLSSLRLVSADGDSRTFKSTQAMAGATPDGIADWAVGVLRSSGRGVAYHTAFGANRMPLPCGGNAVPCIAPVSKLDQCVDDEKLIPGVGEGQLLEAGGQFTAVVGGGPCNFEAYQRKNASKALYALPSYALNSYRVAGEDVLSGDEGIGWAVGDHGAIATRGGGVAGVEAPPARRGAKSIPEPLSRDSFDEHRAAVTEQPGQVPALVPGVVPTEPGFTEAQFPTGADLMVMSRDGQEGWALNSDGKSFYHYDGLRWAPCDAQGVPDLLPPDPACERLASAGLVSAVARVPLERDSDPTNDEEFEAVALTSAGLYRYRGERWSRDAAATYQDNNVETPVAGEAVAFTAPDDGWVLRRATVASEPVLFVLHFDGEQWVKCAPLSGDEGVPESCGDDQARRLNIRVPCAVGAIRLAQAGERVYLIATRDARERPSNPSVCNGFPQSTLTNPRWEPEPYPVILHHDRGGSWQGGRDASDDGAYNPTDGGWDPGCVSGRGAGCVPTAEPGDQSHQGRIESLSVARNADGSFAGWAIGTFGGTDRESADALMMRLSDGRDVPEASNPGKFEWRRWKLRDAANDYLRYSARGALLTLPSEAARRNAFLFVAGRISTTWRGGADRGRAPALAFDAVRGRWTAIPAPWSVSPPGGGTGAEVHAIAPDGRGGFWASANFSFHHYTDRAPKPVFSETADPTAGKVRITALGAGTDGTVWVGDENGGVHRYDRLAGWSARVPIPEWEPARVTARAAVNAIAVGPDGEGVAVGPGGRIADLGEEVRLDPAATIGCDPQAPAPPCGTGKALLAAAVAPDGSAIVAGENRALLWRPAGGDFRPIAEPEVPLATPIVAVSMPTPDRAYLLTEAAHDVRPASRVIAGEMSTSGQWSWRIEVGDSGGAPDPLTASRHAFGGGRAIRDLAVDASGHGYAVGDLGMVLERTGEGESPWRRVPNGDQNNLRAVALPAGGGEGALIGGDLGHILSLVGGRFEVARHADILDPISSSVIELALTPGYAPGEVEAWALDGRALLHYPADPADARLDPTRGLAALADAPAPSAGEISFAAFGKQDCDAARAGNFNASFGVRSTCGPPDGSNTTVDLVNRRIREEFAARSEGEAAAQFALFSGDAVDGPGGRETFGQASNRVRTPLDVNLKHRRWVEIVADPLAEHGVATFGAIGGQDLARNLEVCEIQTSSVFGGCPKPSQAGAEQLGVQAGPNLPWRAAMASGPAPWEATQEAGGLRFERVGAGVLSQRGPAAEAPTSSNSGAAGALADLAGVNSGAATARTEGYPLDAGDTHYAVDVYRDDDAIARIVVVDTSMRSIAASDPLQHPIEAGGQLRWLDEMTCFEGSAEDTDGDVRDCTREEGQQAIVLSNTPTYSYGPISPEETQTDAAAFEAILLKNQVNVVVSGRLGWNGRYWALAPGVHAPCPGQAYRSDSEAPSLANAEICGANAGGTQGIAPDPNQVVNELPEDARQAAGLAGRGAIPFVVSSTAGGRFNTKAERGGFATAENGFWRGYSIVRLHPAGDPAKTIVEQRPILDWVGIGTHDPSVAPGQRLQLKSFAREAFGLDTAPRYYEIPETQVITHRYHLLLANPSEPWRACEAGDSECEAYYSKLSTGGSGLASQHSGAAGSATAAMQELTPSEKCEPYLCLPERVGTIDPDTGEVRAGNGKYPDTFAIATLSVGRHVAAQPLVFTKSPSFIVNPAASLAEVPPPPTETGTASAPPAPPGTPVPNVPQAGVPNPPPVPPIAPLQATQPPEPQPPAPPAPPPPSEAPAPISLTLAPPGITVATPTAVIQPPTPPVNPAPPGGARREARQRQAAAQKSGADSDQEAGEQQFDGANSPNAPPGAAFTRHDHSFTARRQGRPEPSFTTLSRADGGSGSPALLYTGGITLLALSLALGWSGVRPTPRRRPPEAPAPAWSRAKMRK